jgi:diguanylate cyclase (GGDEF)-like protein/PAS domain S-box-containing protein
MSTSVVSRRAASLTSSRAGKPPELRSARRARPHAWQCYLAFGTVGAFLYLLVPPLKGNALFFNALGMTSWVAVIAGIRRNRPRYALPWYLFALSLFMYWLGDLYTYSYPKYILHHEVPFPSVGDALYLTVYIAQMLGLLALVHRRSPQRDRNTLIDAAILTLGLSLVSWVLLIAPYLHDGTLSLLPKLVSVAYPLGDIILLAAAIRLVLDNGPRRPAFYLMVASIVTVLVTDFVYGVMTLHGSFHHQLLLDIGWFSYLLLFGTAALHPSMVDLEKPVRNREAKLTPVRLGLLTGASLIAPVCSFQLELDHASLKLMAVICASVVLFCLVVMRMVDLVRQQERSVVHERLLSSFGSALVACSTQKEMQQAALEVIAPLLDGPGAGVLCLLDRDELVAVARSDDRDGCSSRLPDSLAAGLLELAAESRAQSVVLDPALLAQLQLPADWRSGVVLALPVRNGILGLLLLAGPGAISRQSRYGLQALATQLALALEGARLSEKIHVRHSEARFASLVQHSSDLITVVAPDATITYQSPSSEHVLGYAPEELLGTRFDRLVVGEDAGRLLRLLADGAAYARGDEQAIECTLRHRDGEHRQFEILHTNLLEDEHVRGIVLNARDISERKLFEAQLAHQAFHDPVTNLANRALLVERARHAISRARRDQRELGVIFLDIDDFKTINDSLGHDAGDAALVEVAKRLSESIRSGDTAARFGGDEFVVLLEDSDSDQTGEVAERILEDLRRPSLVAGKELILQASLGISMLEGTSAAGADELIRDADAAMYVAKREGKGGYRFFEPEMHAGVLARLELRADLQRALENGQFELHYQPIVRLRDVRISGIEALLRWVHPQHGLMAPGDFIPLAEESGMIIPIGRWVLREACHQAAALASAAIGADLLGMSVNLSVRQLEHEGIISDVREALTDSGLEPARLTLEITESMLMDEPDSAVVKLQELRALGVRIAIDDFGTGYSSLSYLSRFPVDVLKMDRSFLSPESSAGNVDLSSAVVALGGVLGLQVVAEGIELEEQMSRLRGLGCGYGQGFYFARPLKLAQLAEYLAQDRSPLQAGIGA